MPKLGYNPDKGYTEFRCDSCGKIVPWSTINVFGHCNECRDPEKDLGREPIEYQERSREIIREYELTASTFHKWVKQFNKTGSFKEADNRTPEEKELIALRKQNKQLLMENDILKQAALIMGRK